MMDWRPHIRRAREPAAYALRMTAAAALALWLAHRLKIALPLWAVLTALVVTQISLGRSLKATLDYFAATVGGVLWGGLVALLVPHPSEMALLFVLVLALAPLAFAAAIYPRFAAGPVTAAIVVLIPQIMHTTPAASAAERIVEVSLGGLTGLFVSFVLMPSSAFRHTREVAARSLECMARAVPGLIQGFEQGLDAAEAHRIQDVIGQQLHELASVAAEAERERLLRPAGDPLTGPLFRTLLRLRHDLVILGRAARRPLPPPLKTQLQEPISTAGNSIEAHLQACADALRSGRAAPPRGPLDTALARYSAQLERLGRAGDLRELPVEALERLFTAGFALEQMRLSLRDLDRCIGEWAARRG